MVTNEERLQAIFTCTNPNTGMPHPERARSWRGCGSELPDASFLGAAVAAVEAPGAPERRGPPSLDDENALALARHHRGRPLRCPTTARRPAP